MLHTNNALNHVQSSQNAVLVPPLRSGVKSIFKASTPLSNTGCAKPGSAENQVLFHLDYLKLTFFAPSMELMPVIVSLLMQSIGKIWSKFSDRIIQLETVHDARIWSSIVTGFPGVSCMLPKGEFDQYVCLELKGEAFTWLRSQDVLELLEYVHLGMAEGVINRYHATRVDFAFDHVPIDPGMMQDWYDQGSLRSKGKQSNRWFDSIDGQTCYIGSNDRKIRLYNRRGYNRLELELKAEHAKQAFNDLTEISVDQWASHAAGRVRSLADFIVPGSDQRQARCKLRDEWEQLFGDQAIKRIRPRVRPETEATPAGKINIRMHRMKKTLIELRNALGDKKFAQYMLNYTQKAEMTMEQFKPDELRKLKQHALEIKDWQAYLDNNAEIDYLDITGKFDITEPPKNPDVPF